VVLSIEFKKKAILYPFIVIANTCTSSHEELLLFLLSMVSIHRSI